MSYTLQERWWTRESLRASAEVIAEFDARKALMDAAGDWRTRCAAHPDGCPERVGPLGIPACLSREARLVWAREQDRRTAEARRERQAQRPPRRFLSEREVSDAIEARGERLFERALGLRER